jgi:hypothetical protein
MNNKRLLLINLVLLFLVACSPDATGPLTADDTIPGPVKNTQVKNISGGAQISYVLPESTNLLYVKAVFDLNGVKTEVKSSFYKNNLVVEGFGDVNEHEVTLYAVNRSEKLSDPVKVTIKPLTPPVQVIRNSFVVGETFGGIFVRFKNPDKANVVVKVLVEDLTSKEWINIENYYTALDSGQFSVRGLQPVLRKFGIYAKDRWNNASDTMITSLVPVYEEQLDRTKFADMRKKNYPVPQISPLPLSGLPMVEAVDYNGTYLLKNLWDNNNGNFFHTKEKVDQPIWLPIDLGVKATLSRFRLWQRASSTYNYSHGNPHKWEIWGTNTINDVNSWVKLGDFTMIKPSGLPSGQNSNEDNEAVTAGHEFEFPIGIPAVRYIAWKNIDSWSSLEGETGFLHMAELIFWGQKQ